MTKKIALLWGILCILVCSCGKGNNSPEESLIKRLKSPGDAPSVSLQEMTDFDWDSMYYFMPYTDKETAERAIGFSSDDITDNLSSDDGVYALFVKGKKVICQIQGLPENLGFRFDFGKIDSCVKLEEKKMTSFSLEKEGKVVIYKYKK